MTTPQQSQANEQALYQAVTLIKSAQSVCILTGAGISAESGIPTFRDKQTGLWEKYRAEDLANIHAFKRDPKTVWSWYQWRRELVHDKKPNPAHQAITTWQSWATANDRQLTLITQNVDDLHEQAGSRAVHLHGHLWRNKCSQCEMPYAHTIDYQKSSIDDTNTVNTSRDCTSSMDNKTGELRYCDACGGVIRPDIVWFGEMLPQEEWAQAEQAAIRCDVFVSIGTSSLVYPAAGLAQMAKQQGAKIIEVNLNPTDSLLIDVVLAGKAGDILPKLVNHIMA